MKHIHFIGIGGIGVSALARYYSDKGYKVSGSDLAASEITKALKKLKIKIFTGKHRAKNLSKNVNLVIYSPAVQPNNPEIKEAKKRKIKIQSYPQALGKLTKKYFTIAVAGSHGKSTTTAMIGLLLEKAGLDPTVIVGTKLKEFDNSNCRVGESKYLVIEADEHFASFLNYWPKIIVLTTIEAEHLDYYRNLNNVVKAFKEFVSHLPKQGILVSNQDDKNISKLLKSKSLKHKNVYYSLKNKEAKKLKKILKIPGDFNVSNALAALNTARALKIPDKISLKSLSKYRGSWRRFELIKAELRGTTRKITIVNDYGHHPTNIRVTLKAAREKFPKKEIWGIFQPHQYQRTYYLFDDFVRALREAPVDKLIVTDIYTVTGREKKEIKKKVNSKKLVKAISKPSIIHLSKEKIQSFLIKNLKGGEIVIIMGAGDIYNLARTLIK